MVGGIGGYFNGRCEIKNCNNYGSIYTTGAPWSYSGVGGIAAGGDAEGLIIENCVNYSDVNSKVNSSIGGIAGTISNSKIINCVNKGKAKNGIIGMSWNGNNIILNCCNLGECSNGIVGKFSGGGWNSVMELTIKNCYNIGTCTESGILGYQGIMCKSSTLNIENCYNAGKTPNAIIKEIKKGTNTTIVTNISNTYYDTSKSESAGATTEGITPLGESDIKNNENFVNLLNSNIGEDSELRRWKIGEDGYPTFE